jgi:hypothetical protein
VSKGDEGEFLGDSKIRATLAAFGRIGGRFVSSRGDRVTKQECRDRVSIAGRTLLRTQTKELVTQNLALDFNPFHQQAEEKADIGHHADRLQRPAIGQFCDDGRIDIDTDEPDSGGSHVPHANGVKHGG